MKKLFPCLGTILASCCLLPAAALSQQAFSVRNAAADRLGAQHLCSQLNGRNQPPTLRITHTRNVPATLTISMRDDLSNGRVIDHGTTTVNANPSGTTVVRHPFLAPCNRIHANGGPSSRYSFVIRYPGGQKAVVWGRYPLR